MKCECCGHKGQLVEHHWFQPPRYVKRTKKVCKRCNSILVTRNFGFAWRQLTHKLPNWGEQKEYVQQRTKYEDWNEQFEYRMRAKYGYHSASLLLEAESRCESKGIDPNPESDSFCEILVEIVKENPAKKLVFNPRLRTRFGKLVQ